VVPILERSGLKAGKDFWLSHCPERAMPGQTLHELVHNARVIGGIDDVSSRKTKELYASFVRGEITITDATTAEMVKLMENTNRDVQIAIANEFARIADKVGVDVWEAIALANRHPRVSILNPGPGVGGHCIAVDPYFLSEMSDDVSVIRSARHLNESMPRYIISYIEHLVNGVGRPTISIFGVAYKGNVDDIRETPARSIIDLARERGWHIKVHDPVVSRFTEPLLSAEECAERSDCIVLVADHKQFSHLRPEIFTKLMRSKNLVDARNILDSQARYLWAKAGFKVLSLGRLNAQDKLS